MNLVRGAVFFLQEIMFLPLQTFSLLACVFHHHRNLNHHILCTILFEKGSCCRQVRISHVALVKGNIIWVSFILSFFCDLEIQRIKTCRESVDENKYHHSPTRHNELCSKAPCGNFLHIDFLDNLVNLSTHVFLPQFLACCCRGGLRRRRLTPNAGISPA